MSPWSEALALSLGLHALLLLAPLWEGAEPPDAPLVLQFLVPEAPQPPQVEDPLPDPPEGSHASTDQRERAQHATPEASVEEALVEEPRPDPKEGEEDEEEEEETPSDAVHVVADALAETEELVESHRISTTTMETDEESRVEVPPLEEGPEAPAHSGRSGRVGKEAPQVDKTENSPEARQGERAQEQAPLPRPTPEQKKAAQGGEGEQQDPSVAAGPGEQANAAGGQAGEEEDGRGARQPNPSSLGSDTPALDEEAPSTPEAPDGWEPVVLFDPRLGMPAPDLVKDEDPKITERHDEETELAREAEQPLTRGAEGDAEQRRRASHSVAPSEDFAVAEVDEEGDEKPKTAPGWQGEEVLANTATSSVSGEVELQGTVGSTSLTTPEEEVRVGDTTSVNAIEHPYAEYMAQIEGILRSAWLEQMPVAFTAMGMQGTTTVRLVVDSKGRVVETEVLRQSGYPELDAHALASIPKRLPRPPDGAAEPTFTHTINFRKTDHWAGGL